MERYDHYGMYENASKEQLISAMKEAIHAVKAKDPELHEEMEEIVHECLLGPHFDREEYDRASYRMTGRNGSRGPRWTVQEISDYARRNGDRFDRYNEYDLSYAMNTMYEDYNSTMGDSADSYYRMARQYLENRDYPDGRAWRDYRSRRRMERMGRR